MCSGQLSLLPSVGQKKEVANRIWGEDLVWLTGTVVCLLAAKRAGSTVLLAEQWTTA